MCRNIPAVYAQTSTTGRRIRIKKIPPQTFVYDGEGGKQAYNLFIQLVTLVRAARVELARSHLRGIFLLLYVAIATLCVVVWTIPSPCVIRLGARRLVSTRSFYKASLGIVHLGVPPNLTRFT